MGRLIIGAALLLLGAGAVTLSGAYGAPVKASVLRGDAPIGAGATNPADISSNNSPTLVESPVRPANLALANRIDTPRFGCALHFSLDGGATWTQRPVPLPAGEEPKCFAPDLAFASNGTLYMSFVTLRGRGNVPHAVWVTSSRDGGRTLSRPRRVLGPLAFQVRIATDPLDPRRVYLTWLQGREVGFLKFTQVGNPIEAIRSDDGGVTWQSARRVSSPTRVRAIAPTPAAGPKGELYVLYLDVGQDRLDYEGLHHGHGGPPYRGRFRLVLARSLDRGQSWDESVVDDGIVPIGRFVVFFPAFPSLAVDRHSGRLYAAFHDARAGDPDVWLWSLPAGGNSWSGPTRVNDTAKRDGTAQYLPQIAVAPNGRLDVVYYDRRSDRSDVRNDISLQSSDDSGDSFTQSVRLSSRRFDSRIGFGSKHGLPDLGSRLALVSGSRRSLAIWADTRAGTKATNKQDLTGAVVGFSHPARLSAPAKHPLRYGGLAVALLGLGVLASGLRPRGSAADVASPSATVARRR